MIAPKVQIQGDESDRMLLSVARSLTDLSPVWPKAGKWWARREEGIFARNGRPRWKPLSPGYIVRRRKEGMGGHMLVRTGTLKRAVTSAAPKRATRQYAVFGPRGRAAPHWSLLKTGTSSMPKRDPAPPPTKAERAEVAKILADYVREVIR